jgi:hypothetical protein
MTFSFPLTFSEHYRAYRTAFHRKPSAWLSYAFFVLLPIGIGAAAMIFRDWTLEDVLRENGLLLVAGPAFVVLLVPLLHRLNVRQARTGNRTVEGVQHLMMGAEGFRAWGALYNTAVLWSAVYEVVETRRYFLIYLSELQFFFLPKGAIAEQADVEAVRQLVSTALGDRAKLSGPRRAAA